TANRNFGDGTDRARERNRAHHGRPRWADHSPRTQRRIAASAGRDRLRLGPRNLPLPDVREGRFAARFVAFAGCSHRKVLRRSLWRSLTYALSRPGRGIFLGGDPFWLAFSRNQLIMTKRTLIDSMSIRVAKARRKSEKSRALR